MTNTPANGTHTPDMSARTLAQRRWSQPAVLRQRIDAIRRDQIRLARKRRELEQELADAEADTTISPDTATAG